MSSSLARVARRAATGLASKQRHSMPSVSAFMRQSRSGRVGVASFSTAAAARPAQSLFSRAARSRDGRQSKQQSRAFSTSRSSSFAALAPSSSGNSLLAWLGGAAALSYYAYSAAQEEETVEAAADSGLSPKEYRPFELVSIGTDVHNASYFTFKIPGGVDCPVSSFVMTRAVIDDETVERPYTPVSAEGDKITFLVKRYENGKMSKHFHELNIGDKLELKGMLPKKDIPRNMAKHLVMLAGGSGLTPMLQVLDKIANDKNDETYVTVLYGNNSPSEILGTRELKAAKDKMQNRLTLVSLVTERPSDLQLENLKGHFAAVTEGFIDAKISEMFFQKKDGVYVLVCGPPGMVAAVAGPKAKDWSQGEVGGVLKQMGFTKDDVFKY